jgi:alpha-galactosidase
MDFSNIAYWQGFYAMVERVREAYPDLTIQDCASGGGRANW